jgi:Ca-activated chloride channel family protein
VLKKICREIAAELRKGDRLSIVTFHTDVTVLLDSYEIASDGDDSWLELTEPLGTDWGTDLHDALVEGYALARKNVIVGGLNRVVMVSDAEASVGITNPEVIAEAAEEGEGDAIYLVGVGVGEFSHYNDELMDTVTDLGKGAFLFIDSEEEAAKMFSGERFLANMEVVALDVRVELTLPPYFDMEEFFGEGHSESPEEVEPQHLAPNDAMVFHQLVKTTHPDQTLPADSIDVKVTFTDAITGDDEEETTSKTIDDLLDSQGRQLRKGSAIVAYVQTLRQVPALISDGEQDEAAAMCSASLDTISAIASDLSDADLDEIHGLLGKFCEDRV